MKTLGDARKLAGYTQKMVCEELDVDQSSLAHWEGGYRAIPQYRFEQMTQLYGVHPTEIVLPELKTNKKKRKQDLSEHYYNPRADALRFALAQIVPQEHTEKVIELCAMIYEVENK